MVRIETDDIVGMGYEMVLSVSVLLMRGASKNLVQVNHSDEVVRSLY